MEKKFWFKRKKYPWSWYPVSWQGWLVLLVWAVFFIVAMSMMDHEAFKNILFIILSTFLLIYICYKKGEKPKWQWGKRKED